MTQEQPYDSLFASLNRDTTIITPNRRLSATLHKLYRQYQLDHHQACWQTPDILPVATWIQRLWNEHASKTFADIPFVLNTSQEHFLWENIITSTQDDIPLLQISETAEMAKSAWGLLKQWLVDPTKEKIDSGDDDITLHTWSMAFQRLCQKNKWIDSANIVEVVIDKIKNREIIPANNIILIGFTELSPQLNTLIAYCQSTRIHNVIESEQQRISLKDTEAEILTIARFAKSLITKDKNLKIGCVIPSLDKIRDRVFQIFSNVFGDEPFNISAGKPLLHCPIIYTALQLLSLNKKSISIDTFSRLLTSPFLGHAEFERIRRANFDCQLRRENASTIYLPSAALENKCPQLAKRLQSFFTILDETAKTASYRHWANIFTELLATLGWPGQRSLSSEEYQMVEHWLRLLEEFSSLDHLSQPTTIHRALPALQTIAAKSIFQPKTPDAAVQVLGVLEAAGMPFDYLWVSGMDDMSWPPQPKPHPLISKRLQRELQMPHATAERELLYCQQLIQQFKENSNHIIFSHVKKQDELELQASPLIRHVHEISIDQLQLDEYLSPIEKIYQSKMLETVTDDTAPLYQNNDNIRGGVNVLKQQALCPFKAFAEWRLYAHELESPLPGLRAKDRGSILHKALEIFWNTIHDHDTLISLQHHSLSQAIHTSIDQALHELIHSHANKKEYLFLEKKRLFELIWDWLQLEIQRPPFKVMTSEKSANIKLNHLNFTVRIDRIDEIDSKKLIIDYKTSKYNDTNKWLSDRPEEPQLPLYALLDTDNTIGITFAQIATGKNCFKGVSQYSLDIKGINTTPSWKEQLTSWHHILTTLSNDFYHGVATVDPKNPNETCQWCALKPLCRIKEQGQRIYDH